MWRLATGLDNAVLDQWFSTFGNWRPTKMYKTQFCNPFENKILHNSGFGDPNVGRYLPVEKHCPRPSSWTPG